MCQTVFLKEGVTFLMFLTSHNQDKRCYVGKLCLEFLSRSINRVFVVPNCRGRLEVLCLAYKGNYVVQIVVEEELEHLNT